MDRGPAAGRGPTAELTEALRRLRVQPACPVAGGSGSPSAPATAELVEDLPGGCTRARDRLEAVAERLRAARPAMAAGQGRNGGS